MRHLRQSLAKRVETNHVGVHHPQPHGQRVHAILQLRLEGRHFRLVSEHRGARIQQRHARHAALAEVQAQRKNSDQQPQGYDRDHGERQRVR